MMKIHPEGRITFITPPSILIQAIKNSVSFENIDRKTMLKVEGRATVSESNIYNNFSSEKDAEAYANKLQNRTSLPRFIQYYNSDYKNYIPSVRVDEVKNGFDVFIIFAGYDVAHSIRQLVKLNDNVSCVACKKIIEAKKYTIMIGYHGDTVSCGFGRKKIDYSSISIEIVCNNCFRGTKLSYPDSSIKEDIDLMNYMLDPVEEKYKNVDFFKENHLADILKYLYTKNKRKENERTCENI